MIPMKQVMPQLKKQLHVTFVCVFQFLMAFPLYSAAPDFYPTLIQNSITLNQTSITFSVEPLPSLVVDLTTDKKEYFQGIDEVVLLKLKVENDDGIPIQGLGADSFKTKLDGFVHHVEFKKAKEAGFYTGKLDISQRIRVSFIVEIEVIDTKKSFGKDWTLFTIVDPGQTLHVKSIRAAPIHFGPKWKSMIEIVDSQGKPVPGAKVKGKWTVNGEAFKSGKGKTDENGLAELVLKKSKVYPGDILNVVIESVSKADFTYDAKSNVVGSLTEEISYSKGVNKLDPVIHNEVDPFFQLQEVYVYPNPVKGEAVPTFHVETGLADKVEIRIYNVAGELADHFTLLNNPVLINSGSGPRWAYEGSWEGPFSSGVYLYIVKTEKEGENSLTKSGKFAVIK